MGSQNYLVSSVIKQFDIFRICQEYQDLDIWILLQLSVTFKSTVRIIESFKFDCYVAAQYAFDPEALILCFTCNRLVKIDSSHSHKRKSQVYVPNTPYSVGNFNYYILNAIHFYGGAIPRFFISMSVSLFSFFSAFQLSPICRWPQ
jgi:hypothetical protein